jgi:hypothetical protein
MTEERNAPYYSGQSKIVLKFNGIVKGTGGVISNNLPAIENHMPDHLIHRIWQIRSSMHVFIRSEYCCQRIGLRKQIYALIPRAIKDAIEARYESMSSPT